jgi:hypothetical protein
LFFTVGFTSTSSLLSLQFCPIAMVIKLNYFFCGAYIGMTMYRFGRLSHAVQRTLSGIDPLWLGPYRHPLWISQLPITQNQKIEVDLSQCEKDAHSTIEGESGGTQMKQEVPTVNGAGEITPGEPK